MKLAGMHSLEIPETWLCIVPAKRTVSNPALIGVGQQKATMDKI